MPSRFEGDLDVAVLVHDLRASGVVRNALRIVEAAQEDGLRAELWVIRNRGEMSGPSDSNVAIRAIFDPGKDSSIPRAIDTFIARKGLTKHLDSYRPAVLLSAGNHVHALASRARARARLPDQTRLVVRASNAPAGKLPRHWLADPVRNALIRRNIGRADRIVAVSAELADRLKAVPGISSDKIVQISNGVDMALVRAGASQPANDDWFDNPGPPVILAVGRLTRQKGFDTLIDAFAVLRQERRARLVIIGKGSTSARQALLDRAIARGVDADMRLLGYRGNPFAFMSRSALLVVSSRWEGASNVLIEALACGTPVVATSCPTGVREILAPGDIGPLVPVDDHRALAAAMGERLDAPRNEDALRAWAARHDLATALAGYVSLIRDEAEIARRARARAARSQDPRLATIGDSSRSFGGKWKM